VRQVRLTVEPLPEWLAAERLLGSAELVRTPIEPGRLRVEAVLDAEHAADVEAQLRGLGLDGRALRITLQPPSSRAQVRAARLREARARRDTTPGFIRPGVRVTGEGRYSLTPEPLALALGRRAAGLHVIDACCGSGGNAIGFARAGSRVTAIELDPARLEEARHNAAVYGVRERIEFHVGDARALLPALAPEGALLFVDPPWGEHYDKRASALADLPLLADLLENAPARCSALWLKVPASFDVASVPGARASAWFGEAAGDHRRVKFLLLERAP
jgi:predicted RNA methylase